MPLLIPSENFLKIRKEKEKVKKENEEDRIYLIIKKEYDPNRKEDMINLINDIKYLNSNFIYHEIYIKKGNKIESPHEILKEFSLEKIKEKKLKEDIIKLTGIIDKLIYIIEKIRERKEKEEAKKIEEVTERLRNIIKKIKEKYYILDNI